MQAYLIIPILIYLVVPTIIVVTLIYLHRRHRRLFHWIVWMPVFLCGLFAGAMLVEAVRDARHQRTMAYHAGHLMDCATLIREGEVEHAISALDAEINWRLGVSVWDRDMKELPDEILFVWQDAKVYYDKYDVVVVGHGPLNHHAKIRSKLEQVPWSEREADRRAFEAKYKSGPPEIAPDLDIKKWLGPSLPLDQLAGSVVLLDIWGLKCKPCIAALPDIQELHNKLKDEGLVVIAVHGRGGDAEEISKFIEKNNYSFPVAIDAGNMFTDYGVVGIPAYYLIDKRGRLVWGPEHGVPSQKQIRSLLKQD